jgi:phage portal protein BeeE
MLRYRGAVAFWPSRARTAITDAQTQIDTRQQAPFPLVVPTWSEQSSFGAIAAAQVPAFTRCLRLITGTVAQLPLWRWDGSTRLEQITRIEAANPYWTTMQRTTEDVVLYGKAYWEIVSIGVTTIYALIPAADTSTDTNRPGWIRHGDTWKRIQNPNLDPVEGNVVEFTGYRDGVLITGAEIIATGIALNRAQKGYADVPAPAQILKNASNYELSDTEIDELLAGYVAARKASSVAYINAGVDLVTFGHTPEQLQLVDSLNANALEIARLFNLEPAWVGASVQGTSLTYQNRVDMRTDLIDLCLTDYLSPIEQRLSMPDQSTAPVRFDTAYFTRSNLDARVQMVNILVPLGVMTTDEARRFIVDNPIPGGQ